VSLDTSNLPYLSHVGAKALELIRMSQSDFPVPPGIVLCTAFFAPWISELQALPEWDAVLRCDERHLRACTGALKGACRRLSFTGGQRLDLLSAMEALRADTEGGLFAVRSSSLEEDLADASFAGGYETVLGVTEGRLEEAILTCFSSCFDERVYAYKTGHGMPLDHPGIAVIVQEQVVSDSAGVAFSINPVSNCYDEAVVSANYGLGESVVSGLIEPDTFVIDKISGRVCDRQVGRKEFRVSVDTDGGTRRHAGSAAHLPCISAEQVQGILGLLIAIERQYQHPVDIEWAISGDRLFLLQVRPITTHFQLPDEMITAPGAQKLLYANSLLIEQGLQEPLSVLGADFVTHVLRSMARALGGDGIGLDGSTFTAGGRYYMNMSYAIKLGGKRAAVAPGSQGDETVTAILNAIDLREYTPKKLPQKLQRIRRRMPLSLLSLLPSVLSAYRDPEGFVARFQSALPGHLRRHMLLRRTCCTLQEHAESLTGWLDFFNTDYGIPMVVAAQLAQAGIKRMFRSDPEVPKDSLANLGASLPGNKTAEMGARMYELALSENIRSAGTFEEFSAKLNSGTMDDAFRERWSRFMEEFGMRCVAEIDVATARPSESPALLFSQLKTMSLATGGKASSESLFEHAAEKRRSAHDVLAAAALRLGDRKVRAFRRYYRVWTTLGGYREMPKHYIAMTVAAFRQIALRRADDLVLQGRLDRRDEVFNLTIVDIDEAEVNTALDLRQLARDRSAFIDRARKCRLLVRIVDSRGRVFHPVASQGASGELLGVSISPGVVQGPVKILHTATEKPLLPGEILVARVTDPGWTPLFLNAAGIVLEIGGVLQHGAVVAREYGIPCVSGVTGATDLLKDGQLIEVDGSNGRVRLVEGTRAQMST
jgi:pyruvate,water dikinase